VIPEPRTADRRTRQTDQRESYAELQARLDAEAVNRWAVIVADWPPLPDEQIRALAMILNRIDARHHGDTPPQ
jgi:hypothetical protein